MHSLKRACFLSLFLVLYAYSQETDCFNQIDDDGDNLADLEDDDCGCYLFNSLGSSVLETDPPLDEYDGNYCFEITSNTTNRTGAIWLTNKIDLSQAFNFNAVIYAGDKDSNGADGFTITFQNQNENALGIDGGGLAYRGITPSIAFEIDTWFNNITSDGNDTQTTTNDHINVTINGNQGNFVGTPQFINLGNIEDNSYRNVSIDWNPDDEILTFQIEGQQAITYQEDIVNNIFNGQTEVWFGFTGSTGAAFNRQVVCVLESETFNFPDAGIGTPRSYCNGENVTFNLFDQLSGNPNENGYWQFNGENFGTGNNVNFNSSTHQAGTYTYIVENNAKGCADAMAEVDITIDPLPETTLIEN